MSELTIEIKGIEEVSRAANAVAREIAQSGNLVAKAALVVERQAKQNASGRPGPKVQTGRLRASITTQIVNPKEARVGTNVKYAPFVEFGHAQEVGRFVPVYGTRKITKGALAGRHEVSQGLGLRLVNPRAPAYPFMSPVPNQVQGQISGVMVQFGNELGGIWDK